MREYNKIKTKHVAILSGVLFLCCILFNVLVYFDISKTKTYEDLNMKKNSNIEWNIDTLSITDTVRIAGWAIIPDEEIEISETTILLRNTKSNEFIQIPTQMRERPDLNEKYNNIDHEAGGFYANIKTKKLCLNDNDYEIIINYKNNGDNFYVETEKYIK